MHRTANHLAINLLMILALTMLGLGCSGDNPTGPADTAISDHVVSAKPIVVEPTYVETFDQHSNVGNWSFFGDPDNHYEKIEPQGGNPGAYLHAAGLDTFAPKLRTEMGVSSIFTGNYREEKVSAIGVDIAIFDAWATQGRPLSLILRHNSGTPTVWDDDIVVYWTGSKMIPMPNGMFRGYDFDIPSQETTLPRGWKVMYGYSSGDDDADWNTVMTDVSQFTFFYGDPEMFFMFQLWELGVDNVRLWYED